MLEKVLIRLSNADAKPPVIRKLINVQLYCLSPILILELGTFQCDLILKQIIRTNQIVHDQPHEKMKFDYYLLYIMDQLNFHSSK